MGRWAQAKRRVRTGARRLALFPNFRLDAATNFSLSWSGGTAGEYLDYELQVYFEGEYVDVESGTVISTEEYKATSVEKGDTTEARARHRRRITGDAGPWGPWYDWST